MGLSEPKPRSPRPLLLPLTAFPSPNSSRGPAGSARPRQKKRSSLGGMEKKEYEPRKLFIGGIPRVGLTADMVRAHFARYGHVVEALVMVYPDGFGRGFGFVEFEDEEAVLRALDSNESDRHDAFFSCRVDVKRAEKKQETRFAQTSTTSSLNADLKVFVGGFGDNVTKDHLIDYFERFGTITDVVVISHRDTRKPRGFGFVTFDSKEATVKVLKDRFHYLNGIKVETKSAEPRDRHRYQNGHHYDSMDMVKSRMYSPHSRYYDSMDMAKGGMYSRHSLGYVPYYNGSYLAYPYPYPYHYTPVGIIDYGYMGNQMDNSYDSRWSHVKGSQQKIGALDSTGMK